MDGSLYTAINGLAGNVGPIDDFFRFITDYGQYILLGLLVILWFWPGSRAERDRWQWGAISGFLSALLALGVDQVIIRFYDRTRPFVGHVNHMLVTRSTDPSFPSDHAAGAFAIAVAVLIVSRRAGIIALLLAVLIAFSRVYVGQHYVSDVLGGAAIGTAAALLISLAQPLIMTVLTPPIRLARRIHIS